MLYEAIIETDNHTLKEHNEGYGVTPVDSKKTRYTGLFRDALKDAGFHQAVEILKNARTDLQINAKTNDRREMILKGEFCDYRIVDGKKHNQVILDFYKQTNSELSKTGLTKERLFPGNKGQGLIRSIELEIVEQAKAHGPFKDEDSVEKAINDLLDKANESIRHSQPVFGNDDDLEDDGENSDIPEESLQDISEDETEQTE